MRFWRIVFYVLLVGVLSGLLLTVVQFWEVIPATQSAERTDYTPLPNVLTVAGFALVMLATIVASVRRNTATKLDWQYGLLWGVAGYAVFFLAPVALGLTWGS